MQAQDIRQYQWKNRLLLLFAPSSESATFKKQYDHLTNKQEEVTERDLLIFQLFLLGGQYDNGILTKEESQKLYKRYEVPRDAFTLLLIGKDGGLKLRRSEFTEVNDIFNLIDSMPMRQAEMRRRN